MERESVWPYFYAGTMGLVMRDGIERLTHAKRYSRFFGTICVGIAWPGYIAGTGRMSGVSPAEMAKSEVVVIWGTNAAATQVNLMTHATRARKEHGAKIVAIDIYPTETMRQADLALQLRPGTDGALACAVMHVALPRRPCRSRLHGALYRRARGARSPSRATARLHGRAPITGLTVEEIEAFAALVGRHKRTFFRLGYGFSRQRNGAANMHAALCIPAVTGAWAHEGGGALHASSAVYKLDKTLIEGLDARDESVRRLDQSRIGAYPDRRPRGAQGRRAGQGDADPEHQSDGGRARSGEGAAGLRPRGPVRLRARAVHDRHRALCRRRAARRRCSSSTTTSTPRARTSFCSSRRRRSIRPPDAARTTRSSAALARRLGAEHRGFAMSHARSSTRRLRISGRGTLAELEAARWLDCQPPFEAAHFLNGFAHPDGKFHFRADWPATPFDHDGLVASGAACPHCPTIGRSTKAPTRPIRSSSRPRRRATSSIRASTRPRPRSPARAGRPRSCIPAT